MEPLVVGEVRCRLLGKRLPVQVLSHIVRRSGRYHHFECPCGSNFLVVCLGLTCDKRVDTMVGVTARPTVVVCILAALQAQSRLDG